MSPADDTTCIGEGGLMPSLLAIVILAVSLSACAPAVQPTRTTAPSPPPPASAPAPAPAPASAPVVTPPPVPRVEVRRDDFTKSTSLVGPAMREGQKTVQLLAAVIDADPEPSYQLLLAHTYGGSWRFYDMAYDEHGTKLPVRPGSRSVLSCRSSVCTYFEAVGIPLDRRYLEAGARRGLRIKLYGGGASEIFTSPGSHIQALLEAADQNTL